MTQETIGLLYWGTGRNLEAINYLARAFVLDPGAHWQVYYGLLKHFSAEVENTRSLETKRDILKTAAEASPKDAELWETLATVYVQVEDWTNTLDALDHIEEIQGADARCATMRYRIYRYLKKDKQAQKALEDHLAINPDEDVVLGMLIDILNEKKAPLKKAPSALRALPAAQPDERPHTEQLRLGLGHAENRPGLRRDAGAAGHEGWTTRMSTTWTPMPGFST